VHAGASSRATLPRPWSIDGPVLRGAAALLFCACASGSAAQVSGTITGVSDYRYRGSTLSDERPAAQAGLAYDDPRGGYAGAFVSTVRLKPPGGQSSYLQAIVYGGYAKRLPAGFSVELGADYSAFADANDLNYGEVFVGASTDILSARIYYSPRYFGGPSTSVYCEIGAVLPLMERTRLHLHAGYLRYSYESSYGVMPSINAARHVIDGRIGLRVDFDPVQLEVAWVGISSHIAAYLVTGTSSPNTVVASLSVSF
jgi:uncharacterized protein (TIGR02001 family)